MVRPRAAALTLIVGFVVVFAPTSARAGETSWVAYDWSAATRKVSVIEYEPIIAAIGSGSFFLTWVIYSLLSTRGKRHNTSNNRRLFDSDDPLEDE